MDDNVQSDLDAKNKRTAMFVLLVVFSMGALAFASVPLYNLFCRVTGYGGTTQVAEALPEKILERKMIVRFDTNTAKQLDWTFKAEQKTVEVRLGERGFISYLAQNNADKPLVGTAVYNVTPAKAGIYFKKIQCFCFGEQILAPGQKVSMPVIFFVDPALDDDPNLKEVTTMTLSYTFFETESDELDDAMEAFYNAQEDGISTTDF